MSNPGEEYYNALMKDLRNIRRTSNAALCCGGSKFTIKSYVNLEFARDLNKNKSTTSVTTGKALNPDGFFCQICLNFRRPLTNPLAFLTHPSAIVCQKNPGRHCAQIRWLSRRHGMFHRRSPLALEFSSACGRILIKKFIVDGWRILWATPMDYSLYFFWKFWR